MTKITFASLFLLLSQLFPHAITAQVAWLTPDNPSITDTVVLTYNSNSGNKSLEGFDGTVYFHTGAITDRSIDGGDWKHVIGNWGEADEKVVMNNIGNGLHETTFVIKDFYSLRSDENIQQIALVFRNESGSKVGKTAVNEDVFLPVNGYIPPIVAQKEYQFESRTYISHTNHESVIDILTNKGITRIIPYTNNIIEIKHFPGNQIVADSSHSIILNPQTPDITIIDGVDWLSISTDSLLLAMHKDPLYVSFVYKNDTILKEEKGFFKRTDTDGLRFEIGVDEKIYGLGERSNALDLVGGSYNLYNRPKYGYEIGARNLNYSIPLIVSSNKYLLLFDNPQKGYADIGESEPGIFEWAAIGGTMKYTVIAGSDFKSISKDYALLTGTQPLPPRWALGNLQSRMGYKTQDETDSIVNLMQKEDFPIDAIILDFYWFGDSIFGTMGRLDWYKPNWPEPEEMISNFKNRGVKTILITEPYILDSLNNFKIADSLRILALDTNGNSYVNREFYFGHGALIDVFKPEAGDWFWQQYKKQMDIGVEGWWGDLGEPENHPADQIHICGTADEVHNIFGHYWHKALFENFRKDYPERRLFNLNRAGFAGSQRYSIYPWTGDVSRSWGGLQAQLTLLIHMSLSGLPFIHSDAGGFAQGALDNELYTRWLQMACFSPILRPHGSGIPSEPVYFNDTTKNIVRTFMKLRYSLLPYIYTLASEANINGYPIVRPLFYEFQNDTNCYNIDKQYMFGDEMMIAPITIQNQRTKDIYLPENNNWYNYWSNEIFNGGSWIEQKTELETIPIFVKAGSFIPNVPSVNTTDDYTTENLMFTYYYDPSEDVNTYTMYDDDGETFGAIANEEYRLIIIKRKKVNKKVTEYKLESQGKGYKNEPANRLVSIELIGIKKNKVKSFSVNGKKLVDQTSSLVDQPRYFFNDDKNAYIIYIPWDGKEIKIKQINNSR